MPVDQDGVRLARRESVPLAPLAQREDDGEQGAAGVGEDVLLAAARRGGALSEKPVGEELAEAVGEDVARDAGPPLELGERGCAVHRVTDDEKAPPVADEVEGAGDGTVGIRPRCVRTAQRCS